MARQERACCRGQRRSRSVTRELGAGSGRIARRTVRVLVFEGEPAVAGAHLRRAAGIKHRVPSVAPRHRSKRRIPQFPCASRVAIGTLQVSPHDGHRQ